MKCLKKKYRSVILTNKETLKKENNNQQRNTYLSSSCSGKIYRIFWINEFFIRRKRPMFESNQNAYGRYDSCQNEQSNA